jgi:glycosyltransferase involved in cell wall biosynthesis/GT2 family glycosyltransferase
MANDELSIAYGRVAELETTHEKQSQELSRLRSEIVRQSLALNRLEKELTTANLLVVEGGQEILQTRKWAQKLQATVADREHQLNLRSSDHRRTLARPQAIEASTTWRLTSPLRNAFALVPRTARLGRRVLGTLRSATQRAGTEGRFLNIPANAVIPTHVQPRDLNAPQPDHNVLSFRTSRIRARIVFVSGEAHTPGHFYRVQRYADAASAAGADVLVTSIADTDQFLGQIKAADIVIIWRAIWSDAVAAVVAAAHAGGATLVFDVDDLMFEPELARIEIIDGIRSRGLAEDAVHEFFKHIRRTLDACDFAIVPTRFLAERMRLLEKPCFVHPNGFDADTVLKSRLAVRARRQAGGDGLVRIGYAAGSRTHQKDFAKVAPAVARVLREQPNSRLVFFKYLDWTLLDVHEFPELAEVQSQIEWRALVPLQELPLELARFDINLAPLEAGNPFCEAKSELKYFEAALAGVPTVASPTLVFASVIRDGETGFLASSEEDWYIAIRRLVDDPAKREWVARQAFHHVLAVYGEEARIDRMTSLAETLLYKGRRAARAFELDVKRTLLPRSPLPSIVSHEIIFENDKMAPAEVTVIVPLYNYSGLLVETLESIKAQTLSLLDLIVIDDASTDASLEVARTWIAKNADRFNRVLLIQNIVNSKLGLTRNVGFSAAETPFVLPVDADNLLLPECAEHLLQTIRDEGSAFTYSVLREFGNSAGLLGVHEYDPAVLRLGNYIDAMTLISKSAWASVGGYENADGWEDYDLWLKFVENGLYGHQVSRVLAGYRVHEQSMLHTQTEIDKNKRFEHFTSKHPWIMLPRPPALALDVGPDG